MQIVVERSKESKIGKVDFDNIPFGRTMSDHMFVCEFKNGEWGTPRITPYQPITMEPSCKVLHYGQAIFEGMKAFKDNQGRVFIFRPEENQKRFNKSAVRMDMPQVPAEMFLGAIEELLKIDRQWIPQGEGKSYYIRPFMISTENALNAIPSKDYTFMVIGGPVQSIFSGAVKVKIADHYSRAANGGVGAAKCAGNYAGQFYPATLAAKEGYHTVVWTDDTSHKQIEEAGQMNFMIRIGDTLLTAPTSDRILDGITRRSVIQLAQDMGIKVEVRPVTVDEVIAAHHNGQLKEAFGVGTAAVISPSCGIGYKDLYMPIEDQSDSFAKALKEKMFDIQYNRSEDPYGWRVEIK